MKNRTVYFFLIGLLLGSGTSCENNSNNSILFEIQNNTGTAVTNIQLAAYVQPSAQPLFEKAELGHGRNYRHSVGVKALPRVDGGYGLKFTDGTRNRVIRFGYFTNGVSLDESFSILLAADTSSVTSVRRQL